MSNQRVIRCGNHGEEPWVGDIVCSVCGAVWQTCDEHSPRYAPRTCSCGAALAPEGDEEFTGRAVCHRCFMQGSN